MLNKNHQKIQVVGVYKQFNQKLRSYSIYSDSLQPISWRYFSPSLALIEWVCNPSNKTPVALRIITTHKPYIKLFFPVFLPLYVKQKPPENSGGWSFNTIARNCVSYSIYSTHSNQLVGFLRHVRRLAMGVESQQQNTCCGMYYKCCFLILQSYFSLL